LQKILGGFELLLFEAIVKAVRDHKPEIAGRVADHLRFRCGMNYSQSLDFVRKTCKEHGEREPSMAEWYERRHESEI
jgi:hypothetical protein